MLRRIFRFFFWTLTLAAVAAGLVAFVLWRELSQDLPPVEELLRYRPPAATLVYAADGSLIGDYPTMALTALIPALMARCRLSTARGRMNSALARIGAGRLFMSMAPTR